MSKRTKRKFISHKQRFLNYVSKEGIIDWHVTLGGEVQEDELYKELLEINRSADNGKARIIVEL